MNNTLKSKREELHKELAMTMDKPKKGVPEDVWFYACRFAQNIIDECNRQDKQFLKQLKDDFWDKYDREEFDFDDCIDVIDELSGYTEDKE